MTFVIFCFLGYIDSVCNRTIKQIFLFYKFLMFNHGDVCLATRYIETLEKWRGIPCPKRNEVSESVRKDIIAKSVENTKPTKSFRAKVTLRISAKSVPSSPPRSRPRQ